MQYSQGGEQNAIGNCFGNKIGNCLSIGENDGQTFSNVLALIEKGWGAYLVEPSPTAFRKLVDKHLNNKNVFWANIAIGENNGAAKMYDSGTHLNNGDTSLLSTLKKSETDRWAGTTTFEEIEVEVWSFRKLMRESPFETYDFISIDAEGNDLLILKQMNLISLGCKCICIEHNSDDILLTEIKNICSSYGLNKVLLKNAENIIMSK